MSKSGINIKKFNKPDEFTYEVSLDTDKAKTKFVKRIENIIRGSLEYRDYIVFLKENVNMNHCAFFNNIQNEQGSTVRIEIHHEPLTLFDIVNAVVNKFLDEGIPLNDLYVADEVMNLHYTNKVGLIPLSKSLHQIIHNSNDIIIPLTMIYGDYKKFIEEYEEYLDENTINKLERKINETKTINYDKLKNNLSPIYTYIEVDGYQLPQKIEIQNEKSA